MDKSFSDYGLADFITPKGDTFNTTNLICQKWLDNYYYGAVYALQYRRNKTQFTFGGAATRYDGQHYGNITWADYGVPDDYQWYNDTANKSDFISTPSCNSSLLNTSIFLLTCSTGMSIIK